MIKSKLIKLLNFLLLLFAILGIILVIVGLGSTGKLRPTGEINPYFIFAGLVLVLPFVISFLYGFNK